MSVRTIMIVALALMFGGSAAVGINALRKEQGAAPTRPDMVQIVVAAEEIPQWTPIKEEMLKLKDHPNPVPKGSFTKLDDVIGRCPESRLREEEVVLSPKLTPKGSPPGLRGQIPEGWSAIALETPDISAAAGGFIKPKDQVDIWLTPSTHSATDFGSSADLRILSRVLLLAVNDQTEVTADSPLEIKDVRKVLLLLNKEQARKFNISRSRGALRLALVSATDNSPVTEDPLPDPPPPPIQLIRGMNPSSVTVHEGPKNVANSAAGKHGKQQP